MGMSRLVSVIGPAPSEVSIEEVMQRNRAQRRRVGEGLLGMREAQTTARIRKDGREAKKPGRTPKPTFASLAAAHGLTEEELRTLLEEKGIKI